MRIYYVPFKYESASATLHFLEPDVVVLKNVRASKLNRGHATAVMQQVIDYADKNDLTIQLSVQRYAYSDNQALDNDQLKAFYEKFGFRRDFRFKPPIRMVRRPRRKSTSYNEKK